MDYGDFVVHIFSEKARGYYDLRARLWRQAKSVETPAISGRHVAISFFFVSGLGSWYAFTADAAF